MKKLFQTFLSSCLETLVFCITYELVLNFIITFLEQSFWFMNHIIIILL